MSNLTFVNEVTNLSFLNDQGNWGINGVFTQGVLFSSNMERPWLLLCVVSQCDRVTTLGR